MSSEERKVKLVSKDAVSEQLSRLKELRKIKEEEQRLLGNNKSSVKQNKKSDKNGESNNDIKNINKKLKDLERKQSELEKDVEKAVDIANDPVGFLKNKVTDILKIGGPLSVVSVISERVIERIQKEFGPGGRFDIRKLVQDAVREILQIEILVARDRGEVFFGSAQNLTQGPPEFSNTERLQDGRNRDLERNIGY